MANIDQLGLLSLIVALAAYVGAVRLAVLGRLAQPGVDDHHKARLKSFLRWLIPADAAFLGAGVPLFLSIFWPDITGRPPLIDSDPIPIWLCLLGIMVLGFINGSLGARASIAIAIAILVSRLERGNKNC